MTNNSEYMTNTSTTNEKENEHGNHIINEIWGMLYCNWYIMLLLIEVFQYKYIQETIICYNIDMKQIELTKMMHYDIFNYKKLYYITKSQLQYSMNINILLVW